MGGTTAMATLVADNLKEVPLPKNTVAVAREDGRIYIVDFSEFPHLDDAGAVDWDVSVSKILISKIQLTRSKLTTMEEIELENVVHTNQIPTGMHSDLQVTLHGSLDGHADTVTSTPKVVADSDGYIKVNCRLTAKNFGVMLRGVYNINTIQVTLHQSGRR